MPFVVLEGFSGAGKTTLAKAMEKDGWLRLEESAHAVPSGTPLADSAGTESDYSLLGATLANSALIREKRRAGKVISEGYVISDLAYAKVRYDLDMSAAFPSMLALARKVLREESLRPDAYILLRPARAAPRGNGNWRSARTYELFAERYYGAIQELHERLTESKVETVKTDTDPAVTLREIAARLRKRGVTPA